MLDNPYAATSLDEPTIRIDPSCDKSSELPNSSVDSVPLICWKKFQSDPDLVYNFANP